MKNLLRVDNIITKSSSGNVSHRLKAWHPERKTNLQLLSFNKKDPSLILKLHFIYRNIFDAYLTDCNKHNFILLGKKKKQGVVLKSLFQV